MYIYKTITPCLLSKLKNYNPDRSYVTYNSPQPRTLNSEWLTAEWVLPSPLETHRQIQQKMAATHMHQHHTRTQEGKWAPPTD